MAKSLRPRHGRSEAVTDVYDRLISASDEELVAGIEKGLPADPFRATPGRMMLNEVSLRLAERGKKKR